MDSIAFEIFGISVKWYGVFVSLGLISMIVFTGFGLKRYKIYNEEHFLGILLSAIVAGIIGARLYYVLFNLGDYQSLWEVINIRNGGLAFHGGIIAGAIAIGLYGRWKKLDTIRYLDIIGVGTLLGQAIGRWGNFFNQEAYGSVVSKEFISHFPKFIQEGMYIDGAYYHPTFLYESISDLLWFLVLAFLLFKFTNIRKGIFLALAVIGNSATRIVVEYFRTDSLMLGNIKVAMLVGVLGIIASAIYLLYIYTKKDTGAEVRIQEIHPGKKKKKKKKKK
ncbi:MAG: prolipoprotein diacylglyceryl transferase [Fusobacteria bacterium]|nr:prolipoprotein diacylglyceryl transferase [Fusobacteriota bacterium]